MGRKKEEKAPGAIRIGSFFMHQAAKVLPGGGTIENLGEDGSGFHFHDANHWLDIISHHILLLFLSRNY